MKYLILIHGNQQWREAFASMAAGDRQHGLDAYDALTQALNDSGELVAAAPLADPTQTLRPGGGRGAAPDGPFAEAKEYIAGFYLVDCDGPERALEIAGRIPEASEGMVEVRPTMDLSAFDW
jgi:hypothetical protein